MADTLLEPADVAIVPHDEDDDDGDSWPRLHTLACVWEECSDVRRSLRDTGRMLKWPKVELTGIGFLSALSENRQAVHDALEVWGSHHSSEAKSPPVNWLKEEAGMRPNYLGRPKLFFPESKRT